MKISNTAVNRPVTVAVLTALLLAIAAFMIPDLTLEMMPDVEPPMVAVVTSYSGAGPLEVEQSVTEILEKTAHQRQRSGLDDLYILLRYQHDHVGIRVRQGSGRSGGRHP